MTEMFVQLKLGDQRYKSKVSSGHSLRRTISLRIKKLEKMFSHSKFHKNRTNLCLILLVTLGAYQKTK